jgi:SanA protein
MIRLFFKLIVLCVTFLVAVVIVANISVFVLSREYIYDNYKDVPEAPVVVVPGAAIYSDGSLSPIFMDRVDMALKLYASGKVSKILVSGDNSTDTYNEVNPARLHLLNNGVPEADIYLDHAGFDTYSTMYRARDIFKADSIIISTQAFHLPRAVFLARMLGIEAYGVNADVGIISFKNTVREIFATVKAVVDLLSDRSPKFLGEEIPIPEV